MKYSLLFLLCVLTSIAVSQPTIDGSFDGEATWGSPAITADGTAGWSGANAKKVYIAYDGTYLYLGAEIVASDWQAWTFLINTKSGGGSTDSWSRNITYTHSNLPDYILRGTFGSYAEFHTWDGSSWSGTGSSYSGSSFGENITGTDQAGWVEGRILLSSIGNPSYVEVEFFITGNNNDHGSFDAAPNEATNSTAWSGAGAHSDLSLYSSPVTVPVELSSLSARSTSTGIQLLWSTATEVNNRGFDVQKRIGSADWMTIGFRAGQGTTNAKTDYSFTDATVSPNASYRLKQIDNDGKFHFSAEVSVKNAAIASTTELKGNYPNPFNPSTSISFTVASTGRTTVKVYDVMGKEIATVADGIYNAGELHSVRFNASGLSSGVYYYRLVNGATVQTRSMILMK